MLAVPEALLLHVPPGVVLLRVVVRPMHTFWIPNIGFGSGFTVIVLVRSQPDAVKQVIVAEPAVIPVTTPNASTDAIAVFDDDQFVAVPLDNVMVEPSHTAAGPVIGSGSAFTVNASDERQPPTGNVYVILVVPAVAPVTTPPLLTGAITGEPELHTPPDGELFSVVAWPTHTWFEPNGTAGVWLTTTVLVREQPSGDVPVISAEPMLTPVITPIASIDAIPVLSDDQMIPGVVLLHVIVWPSHTAAGPLRLPGSGLVVATPVM